MRIFLTNLLLLGCFLSRHPSQGTDLLTEASWQAERLREEQVSNYGVDVSFPMHHIFPMENDTDMGDMDSDDPTMIQRFSRDRLDYYYNHFLRGCFRAYGEDLCRRSENERIEMSKRQPATMKNMTKGLGFRKTKVPTELFEKLLEFWHQHQQDAQVEEWPDGSTYLNHWESPPSVVRIDNETLQGGGYSLTQAVWDTIHPIVADWTGHILKEASMYGIRVYHTGAVLATHVDRNPLVSSAIINVAQDVDKPWYVKILDEIGRVRTRLRILSFARIHLFISIVP